MSIGLIQIIGQNQAEFKNRDNSEQELGMMIWTALTELGNGTWSVTVNGFDVEGNAFEEQEIEIQIIGEINATKVFWAVVAVLKEVLCSECS